MGLVITAKEKSVVRIFREGNFLVKEKRQKDLTGKWRP